MAVHARALVVAILLVSMPMLGALADGPSNDAGTGEDAPDRAQDAIDVVPGNYTGNLTPSSHGEDHESYDSYENDDVTRDADWFRVDPATSSDQPACTSATYIPDEDADNETRVHLRHPGLDSFDVNTTTTAGGTTLSVVGANASGALAGLSAIGPPRVTGYTLGIDVLTLGEASGAGPHDEVPGHCFGGELADWETHEWTFEGEEGQVLYLTFATELSRVDDLELEAPNGSLVGSIGSGEDVAIGSTVFDQTGTYTLSADASDMGVLTTHTSDYIVGFSIFDPEEEEKDPCRPHCMS